MQNSFIRRFCVDWQIFVPAILISLAGLVTMNSFAGENYFFSRQSVWLLVSVIVFFFATTVDWRFLRRTSTLVPAFLVIVLMLVVLVTLGQVTRGVQSWFQFGALAFQPSDPAKFILILILAKYFSRRHIEIRNIRHIIVSGIYALIIFLLIFIQPDFGGAIVVFSIWFGLVLLSGISKKHLTLVIGGAILTSAVLWIFVLAPYQKTRVISFIHPLSDIRGAGYNAYQSTVAVGSGGILGKGVGLGSQSKLQYLPEYETDFIFAAFVEEWGFVGAIILLSLVVFLLFRIIDNAQHAATNFETFFGLGVVVLFAVHVIIHAGMNMGALPVTGITFPLMSYGGSHLMTEWLALGILSSLRRYSQGSRLV